MQRIIRLKCPACQAAIEATVTDQERVPLICPACSKGFVAKVPPPPGAVVGAEVVKRNTAPVVAAKPVVPATPKRPANPYLDNVPPAPQPDPLSYPIPMAPISYNVVRKRKPVNLKPILAGVGGVTGLILVVILGLFGWQWAANTDWSTFSLIPVSHTRLLDQLVQRTERNGQQTIDTLNGKQSDIETIKKQMLELGQEFEGMLVRAVRMKWAPNSERTAFRDRIKAIDEKFRTQIDAKLKALRDAKQPPPSNGLDAKQMEELASSPAWIEAQVMTLAAAKYLAQGLFDLPAPANQPEQIYYEEADLVHEYLKVLSNVRRTGQCAAATQKIDQLSEKVMQLAIRRSKLPPNAWEVVPREYVEKDAAFMIAQRALIVRLKRDTQPDEALKDAVANFLDARQRILDATHGTSEIKLRDQFAENKRKREATSIHTFDDPFYENRQADRDLVAKPRVDLAPEIEMPSMTDVNPYAPLADTTPTNSNQPGTIPSEYLANNSTPPASSTSTPPPASQVPNSQTSVSQAPNSQAPNSGNIPPGYVPRSPFGRGAFPGPDMLPRLPGNFMDRGEAFVRPPDTFVPPKHDPSKSVKVTLINFKLDLKTTAEALAKKVGTTNFSYASMGSTTSITLDFAGDLQIVAKAIDFGNVELVDQKDRVIIVRSRAP